MNGTSTRTRRAFERLFSTRPRPARRRRLPSIESLEDRRLLAVSLQFDYSLDDGFFTSTRRTLLETDLRAIAARLGDALAAVSSRSYALPTSSGSVTRTTSVAADTIKIYVWGDSLSGSTAGQGGGFWSTSGSNNAMRGQGANDYAPNVAYLKFDDDGSTGWYFGSAPPGSSSGTDFLAVARHEFLHALGFLGGQPTFARFVQNGLFTGPNARAANGGASVAVSSGHLTGVTSIMNAQIPRGVREIGALEWAILKDLGWSVLAAPSGFYRRYDLFTGGSGDGYVDMKVVPSRGVYLLRLDVLAGDSLRIVTRDGSTASERGVDSYLRIFDSQGRLIATDDDSAGSGSKEDYRRTFSVGGTFWVGVGTYDQRDYTFTSPSTAIVPSTAFRLRATLTSPADAEARNIIQAAGRPAVAFSGGVFTRRSTLAPLQDYYRIDARAGHVYTVSTSLPSVGGLAGPAIVAVYDAAGRRVAAMSGSQYGQAAFTAPSAGAYYVRVADDLGPATIPLDEPDGQIGIGGSDGEYSDDLGRVSGSDYELRIVEAAVTVPQPPPPPTSVRSVEPLYVDYGAAGLWAWTEAAGFNRINPADPENLAVAPDGTLYIDFGPHGLWSWTSAGGINRINPADPEQFAAGADGTLYVDFGPHGLWAWTAAGGINRINPADPEGFAPAGPGTLYVDFGPHGLWIWSSAGGIHRINPADPEEFAVAADGTLFIDFGPHGLWAWTAAAGIRRINTADPEGFAPGGPGELFVDYGPHGLWSWTAAAGINRINTANPDAILVALDGWHYVDFGASGLWRWTARTGYQRLNTLNPERIVARTSYARS
ncbi:hypothetical protein [Paludisphaera soli]|uniref:hypothetical protein n=1 Tax=Paludisphaera soli TaxID=2712865 RepID=UPI0013EC1F5F|nr:hypothetical protein [Paludisphaera soli]